MLESNLPEQERIDIDIMSNILNNTTCENFIVDDVIIESVHNVVFKNIHFKNTLRIKKDVVIENCTFINCSIDKLDVGTGKIKNCVFINCIIEDYASDIVSDCKFVRCTIKFNSIGRKLDPLVMIPYTHIKHVIFSDCILVSDSKLCMYISDCNLDGCDMSNFKLDQGEDITFKKILMK